MTILQAIRAGLVTHLLQLGYSFLDNLRPSPSPRPPIHCANLSGHLRRSQRGLDRQQWVCAQRPGSLSIPALRWPSSPAPSLKINPAASEKRQCTGRRPRR